MHVKTERDRHDLLVKVLCARHPAELDAAEISRAAAEQGGELHIVDSLGLLVTGQRRSDEKRLVSRSLCGSI